MNGAAPVSSGKAARWSLALILTGSVWSSYILPDRCLSMFDVLDVPKLNEFCLWEESCLRAVADNILVDVSAGWCL